MPTPFLLFLGDLGGGEILLILGVILIFFGAKRIPELARGLGQGLREFKDASGQLRGAIENAGPPAPVRPPVAPLRPLEPLTAPVASAPTAA